MKRQGFHWTILNKTGVFFLFLNKNDIIHSYDDFLLNMNEVLDKHVSFKKVSQYQLKLKTKPQITAAIYKTSLVKNSLFKKYITLTDPVKKIETHDKYKQNRDLLSTVTKKVKRNHYMNSLKIT